jgi:hypothetical protein
MLHLMIAAILGFNMTLISSSMVFWFVTAVPNIRSWLSYILITRHDLDSVLQAFSSISWNVIVKWALMANAVVQMNGHQFTKNIFFIAWKSSMGPWQGSIGICCIAELTNWPSLRQCPLEALFISVAPVINIWVSIQPFVFIFIQYSIGKDSYVIQIKRDVVTTLIVAHLFRW